MSKKHNIAYVRPEDPSFLRKLKEQVGYKEGPTVDTKREVAREEIPEDNSSEEERDEKPTVVVLNPGDLTAEEAEQAQKRLEKEEEETPADLSQRVIFKRPVKKGDNQETPIKGDTENTSNKASKRSTKSTSDGIKKNKKLKSKHLLSFDEEDAE